MHCSRPLRHKRSVYRLGFSFRLTGDRQDKFTPCRGRRGPRLLTVEKGRFRQRHSSVGNNVAVALGKPAPIRGRIFAKPSPRAINQPAEKSDQGGEATRGHPKFAHEFYSRSQSGSSNFSIQPCELFPVSDFRICQPAPARSQSPIPKFPITKSSQK